NTEDENFDEFLDEYRISELITKYSDYIRYPIRMDMTKSRLKEGSEDEYESYTENTTINSMIPIWKKAKNEVTDEDYNTFYSEKFHDASVPARRIHTSTEGTVSYTSLLFIPSRAPYDYYTRDFEKGLALYANGVMIMEKCEALLPDYFSFVRGLVDSQDLSLNISRELLQHDRQLRVIAASIEKKVRAELMDMLENEREEYEKFYANFGIQLKYGTYANFGQDKDKLRDLLMFNSSNDEKLTTLKEYVTRMKDGQEHIYYAAGDSIGKLKNLPQSELVRSRGFEILYLTDDVDEFALRILNDCDGKTFKSVTDGDSCLETEDEKKEIEAKSEENRAVLDAIKEALGDKVGSVKLSPRLTTCPVCLTTEGGISTSMEKVLNAMPNAEKIHAQRVLEINASHP
ncbi:MAG: molecular chaperone HtpG, partial [Oscillospiraceae bacterium]